MEKLIIICTVLIILSGAIVGLWDVIHTHYIKQYIKILENQNDVLKENIKVDNKILLLFKQILAKSEETQHE